MNLTLPSPSAGRSHSGQNALFSGAKKIAMLAAALLVVSAFVPRAEAGTVKVDIYGDFNANNAPSGSPYSSLAGQLELSSDDFTGAGYDFGMPFGLSSFAAVITFTQYMSTTGFYIGGLNSGTAPVLWAQGGIFNPFYGSPWAAGAAYNEIEFTAGYNDFELVLLARESFPGADGIGGEPYNLSLDFFTPWGGDPRVTDGAYSYVTDAGAAFTSDSFAAASFESADFVSAKLAVIPHVPDSVGTLGILAGALAVLIAFRRKLAGLGRISILPAVTG